MKTCVVQIGLVMVLGGIVLAADLNTSKEAYEKNLEQIILDHGMKIGTTGEGYIKSLDAVLVAVKKTGDLDKTTSVLNEMERFRKEKSIPENVSEMLDIKNLQAAYNRQVSALDLEKAKKTISLASGYDTTLAGLQKNLVSADKLDEARAVQEERKRVEGSESFLAAKAIVAKLGTGDSPVPAAPALTNIAALATITASSEFSREYRAVNVADGVVQESQRGEWATLAERKGACIKLEWDRPHLIRKVVLYERPNHDDWILQSVMSFGDLSSVKTDKLPNNGDGKAFDFKAPKKSKWMKITISEANGPNPGFSEIEVFAEE